jgi:hypothetical protein
MDIANLVPMIEIGIVEPSIATNTIGNFNEIRHASHSEE